MKEGTIVDSRLTTYDPYKNHVSYLVDLFYMPPIEFFVAVQDAEEIWIERHDNYQKQSYRNRATVQLANQVKHMSIPVLGGNKKSLYTDIQIDYSQSWKNVHLRGIRSAYGNAPFFEFFFPEFEKIFLKNHGHLWDLNLDLLTLCLKCLRHTAILRETYHYERGEVRNDWRGVIKAKEPFSARNTYAPFPYAQIFGVNFAPNLSIVDLLFCEGPNSNSIILQSKRNNEQ